MALVTTKKTGQDWPSALASHHRLARSAPDFRPALHGCCNPRRSGPAAGPGSCVTPGASLTRGRELTSTRTAAARHAAGSGNPLGVAFRLNHPEGSPEFFWGQQKWSKLPNSLCPFWRPKHLISAHVRVLGVLRTLPPNKKKKRKLQMAANAEH